MNERLKEVRKYLGKTQKDFGKLLGVSRDTYASYETGRVIPNDTFVQLLCSLFNISEEWLRNGTGEMFIHTPKNVLDELVVAHGLTGKETAIVSAFLDLSPAGRSAIIEYVEKAASILSANPSMPTRDDLIAQRIRDRSKMIADEQKVKK